jgi:hypothetical protein
MGRPVFLTFEQRCNILGPERPEGESGIDYGRESFDPILRAGEGREFRSANLINCGWLEDRDRIVYGS